ncbi:MAG: YqaA family protein [Gammaproteobacteria bacterium]|nr:MAG: YqaA family protein [Gammaproteobacteria bacterium]
MFKRLYDKALVWAAHRHAPRYLTLLSFAEASFFPVPPDIMLAPMCLTKPGKALAYATITTIASVTGGLFGYLIGYFAIEFIEPLILAAGYQASFLRAREWFTLWGFWVVFAAGFSPIPYKVFTITAGAMALFLPAFLAASLVGRGARFFLVAWLVVWGGKRVERHLRRHIEWLGWIVVIALVVLMIIL